MMQSRQMLIPPLREIKLITRPHSMRAIAFSCDGELAIAADDSIHILVPEFPVPAHEQTSQPETHDNLASQENWAPVSRGPQYSHGGRQIHVSRPPVHPRVNEELFDAAGLPFPYGRRDPRAKSRAAVPSLSGEEDSDGDDTDAHGDADNSDSDASSNTPFGAGFQLISGSGSTLNHIVSLQWSPTGLGVNRRPVLAVLGARGMLAVYGDRAATASLGMAKASEGMLALRSLDSWSVVFGAGERLVVPGQQTEIAEAIKSFAWARDVGSGQALLAYVNDQHELAILSVQTTERTEQNVRPGAWDSDVVWHVQEVVRVKLEMTHLKPSITDPSWTPFGTAFGLSFSPWDYREDSMSCLLSHVDRSYVGFRRVTIKTPWEVGKQPDIAISEQDIYGQCVYTSNDAFFEFEDTIHMGFEQTRICRGILNTGFYAKAIQLDMYIDSVPRNPHRAETCHTAYPNPEETQTNPIVDLVLLSPDPTVNGPIYELIRASATHTNDDWFETNAPAPYPQPRWIADLRRKLGKSDEVDELPQAFASATAAGDPDGEDVDDEAEEEMRELTGQTLGAHDKRFRMYGLARSPGNGVAAVLVMAQSILGPERGNWHTRKSSVLFHWTTPEQDQSPTDPTLLAPTAVPLTTEGRMLEYMYGGGADVWGVTTSALTGGPAARDSARKQELLQALFQPAVARQTCDLDGRPLRRVGGDAWTCGAHVWGVCGTSGLAIAAIGVARVCAVCGLRTLPHGRLAAVLEPERRVELEKLAAGDVCGHCGGKFLN